jgi:predicted transposase/invertase (TIGR01784 family)
VEQDLEFDRYSDHTSKLVREGRREGAFEGRREGAFEIARKMLVRGRPLEEIVEDSGLTKEEVEAMTTSASHEDRCKS